MTASSSFDDLKGELSHHGYMSAKKPTPIDPARGRRLSQAMTERGFVQETLAAEMSSRSSLVLGSAKSITRGAVGNWVLGKGMTTDNLKLASVVLEVPLQWILTGAPPYPDFAASADPPMRELKRVPVDEALPPDPEFSADGDQVLASGEPFRPKTPGARPEIDVRPGAGQGQDGMQLAYTTDAGGTVTGHRVVAEWLMPDPFFRHELRASPDGTIFMEVIGNSMLPTLAPGDRVIVDTRQNTFGPDAIYVFDDGDGEPRVKSLKKMLGTGDVRIISDNRDSYGEDVMSLASIRIIGRVVGKVSKL